ncbi:MAG: response regulator transcription factor [Saprospiraceae bacterium]|jgi:two-component system alkaline phosphatase synthesis response regulator PhoP|nr:response regulator transcription factor [Saprospiraceae bacterium]MBP6236560.1 response regulator transcription factor [Saprospiraceae bacterium]MBP6567778.1 response regulator transcription factor [Saprospiraceae bacterium]
MRILLVEDEEQLRKIIKMNLEMEGFEVIATDNGRIALELTDQQHFDLMILDVMLPEVNGFQICEQVRLRNAKVGIIIVSAKDTSLDRITGLKLGADDYLTKPFNLEELLLRVHNLLKRSTEEGAKDMEQYEWGGNKINFVTYQSHGVAGDFQLTKKEILLLKLLIERQNEVVSRQQILQTVWGYDVYPSTRTIDNFILSFRKYFEKDPREPIYFHSVRGVGYKFTPIK